MEISAVLPTACAAVVNQEVRIGRFSHKEAQRTRLRAGSNSHKKAQRTQYEKRACPLISYAFLTNPVCVICAFL
jgi:hypothetical protein